jgi:hypothetical protein
MKYFTYDQSARSVEIADSRILAVKEFKALLEPNRNKCELDPKGTKQLLAMKEIVYMFLYLDWDSPYFTHSEEDKQLASYEDSGLTEEQLEDEIFVKACIKYNSLQTDSLNMRLLKSAMNAVEKVSYYLDSVDPNERNPLDGKPIFKTKDIIAEIKGAKDLITSLQELEAEVKKGVIMESSVRGGATLGFYDQR